MKKPFIFAAIAASVLLGGYAYADRDDVKSLSEARITLIQAIEAAQAAQGGQAYEASIDDDSFSPEYEVSIVKDDRIYDVQVDAVSGEIIRVHEDTND